MNIIFSFNFCSKKKGFLTVASFTYELLHNSVFVHERDFKELKESIIHYCSMYQWQLVLWLTPSYRYCIRMCYLVIYGVLIRLDYMICRSLKSTVILKTLKENNLCKQNIFHRHLSHRSTYLSPELKESHFMMIWFIFVTFYEWNNFLKCYPFFAHRVTIKLFPGSS